MNDFSIRRLLQRTELTQFIQDPYSLVVEELCLPVVKARIDIAVINGHLHGYEIKSAIDTLQRLPSQISAYSKVFDYLTVVTEFKYLEKIQNIVPKWIGIAVCSGKIDEEQFEIIVPPMLNNNQEGFYIAKLLWHSELLEVLDEQRIDFKKKQRTWLLCETLASQIETQTLSNLVRAKIKERLNWKIKEGYLLK